MAKVLILQGPPASGKTTYRKELTAMGGWQYVNGDERRIKHPEQREHEIQDAMQHDVHEMLSVGANVIIDNTNLSAKRVQSWIDIAKAHHADYEIKTFNDVPFHELNRRDAMRAKPVGRSFIFKMCVNAGLMPVPHRWNDCRHRSSARLCPVSAKGLEVVLCRHSQ